MKCIQHDQNIPSTLEDSSVETVHLGKSRLNEAANELSQTRGVLTRQTSMHQEKKNRNESYDVSKRTNEYVENWLEKAHLNPTAYPEEKTEAVTPIETQTSSEGEYGNGMT
ncbi:hypothetical protein PBY51_014161 [Eleginops maclovinus]|uniref:Uncharacterized protein n=1 Tax=Eleginops maclovinus TaxID=56733 RepID=A0AAN7WW55_ELEMC|nr:hypothetical protein PBY51_014161 [Eleginops maclovinus]